MIKRKLFISYSNLDKVDLIKNELTENEYFEPIIIAFNREATKLLSDKVKEGLNNSDFVIPILTSNSIKTQWINQEIGYSYGINRNVIPIVDSLIINDLKGFIHKQIDLPYNYKSNTNKGQENKTFIKCLRTLIKDLENEILKDKTKEKDVKRSKISELSYLVNMKRKEVEFLQEKEEFLSSDEGHNAFIHEVKEMVYSLESKVELFKHDKVNINYEREISPPEFIAKMGDYSFSIAIRNEMERELVVMYLKGWVSSRRDYPPSEKPKRLNSIIYKFDRGENGQFQWVNKNEGSIDSNDLCENCFEWIIKMVI